MDKLEVQAFADSIDEFTKALKEFAKTYATFVTSLKSMAEELTTELDDDGLRS